jgi:hypothetical protein
MRYILALERMPLYSGIDNPRLLSASGPPNFDVSQLTLIGNMHATALR